MITSAQQGNKRVMAYAMIALASMFYVYEFFLRVTPTVITHELMRDFHINAAQLGWLGVSFYVAYTPMQIPAGLLLDRFGPKRLLTGAVLLCAIATLACSQTHAYPLAWLTRCLVGAASSFAFIGPLALASRWFPSNHMALIAGFIQVMGCMGALIGGQPIAHLVAKLGWQTTLLWASGLGLLLSIAFWMWLKDHPKDQHHRQSPTPSHSPIKEVLTPQNALTGLAGMASWAPMVVIAELWGVAFLKRAYGMDAAPAASLINWLWIGVAIGSPLGGWLSDQLQSRRVPLMVAFTLATSASLAIIWGHPSQHLLPGLMFLLGFSAYAQPVTFGLIGDNNAPDIAGTAMGFNNMCVIAAAGLQWLVGVILQSHWQHHMHDGAPVFSHHHYQWALSVLPLASLTGLVATWLGIRETHGRPTYLEASS